MNRIVVHRNKLFRVKTIKRNYLIIERTIEGLKKSALVHKSTTKLYNGSPQRTYDIIVKKSFIITNDTNIILKS